MRGWRERLEGEVGGVKGWVHARLGVVSCSACTRLPARNGLVNEVKFLGLITQRW